MKLELKHLAPYLPYQLKGIFYDNEHSVKQIVTIELLHIPDELTIINSESEWNIYLSEFKPILRRLSDLERGEQGNHVTQHKINLLLGEDNKYGDFLFSHYRGYLTALTKSNQTGYTYIPLKLTNRMLELLFADHFDVFGLIDAGLAIDINTIAPTK